MNQTNAVKWLILPALTVALSSGVHATGDRETEGNAIVPIVSVQIINNTCSVWKIQQTYTATVMPRSVISTLAQFEAFSVGDHYHAGPPESGGNGVWSTELTMTGTPEQKLARINKEIFGTTTPAPGATQVRGNNHNGTCAADQHMRECVGVFVHAIRGQHVTPEQEPTTFPAGFCVGIPPANANCSFSANNALIDLGSGGMGKRTGGTIVSYSCTRPTTYRVSMVPTNEDGSGIQLDSVRINGNSLPTTGSYQTGIQQMHVDVEAVVNTQGRLATSRVLYIDIP